MAKVFRFSEILIKESVVFFQSKLSFGFVNIKPVVPGHVLLSPKRVVKRFSDLTNEEVTDLFLSVKKVSPVVEMCFSASSLSIALQDGPEAGQTVEHVHVHILPRKAADFAHNDEVYEKLDQHDKCMSNDDNNQGQRTEKEMNDEAALLRAHFPDNQLI